MVFIKHNSLRSDMFLNPYLFHVFQDSCFSGFRFFRVQVFQCPGPGFRSRQNFEIHLAKLWQYKVKFLLETTL